MCSTDHPDDSTTYVHAYEPRLLRLLTFPSVGLGENAQWREARGSTHRIFLYFLRLPGNQKRGTETRCKVQQYDGWQCQG